MMYSFNQLLADLRIGREVEFKYENQNYSITNNSQGWQLCIENAILLQDFLDIEEFILEIADFTLENGEKISTIFDNGLYESQSLYIL